MPNLTELGVRREVARQVTSNRDGVIDPRRDTRLPDVTPRADMRNSFRTDHADEVRRVLGMIPQIAAGVSEIETNRATLAAPADQAAGASDATGGKEADEAKAKSVAYQEAYYGVKAEGKFNEFALSLQQETDDLLNQGASTDEIQRHVLERVQQFHDGVLTAIPDPQAQVATAQRLSAMGARLNADLATGIKRRTDKDLLDTQAGNIQAAILSGQPVDFEANVLTLIKAHVDPAEAKAQVLATIVAVATDRAHPRPELLTQLLASTRADGRTPSLSPQERMQVSDRVGQADDIVRENEKRARDERRKVSELAWYTAAMKGDDVDADIEARVRDGTFDPQEGIAWSNATAGVRHDIEEGHANERLGLDLRLKLADPRANVQAVRKQIVDAYTAGSLGTGLAAQRMYVGLMGNVLAQIETNEARADRRAAAGAAKSDKYLESDAQVWLNSAIKPQSMDGIDPTPAQVETYLHSVEDWRARVRSGQDPWKTAHDVAARAHPPAPARTGPPVRTFDAGGRLH